MLTVTRIAFGKGLDACDAKAVQMVGPLAFQGLIYPPGHWVVMYPGRREIVSNEQFKFRYREVETCATA